jgi:hypothetical protein
MRPITRPDEIANWIMMGNNQRARGALIVEGESDTSVFLFLADTHHCRLFIAEGKKNVIDAIAIVQRSRYPGVVAVVDADFWNLDGVKPSLPDVFITDTHDLETMMLSTRAYHKLLVLYRVCSLGTVEIKDEELSLRGKDILDRIQGTALRLGYIRWASLKYGLRIRFKELPLRRCIDPRALRIEEERLETEITRASDAGAGSWVQISARAEGLRDHGHDPWQVCRGHDITEILSVYLENSLRRPVSRTEVEIQLAACYDSRDFAQSTLYTELSSWEVRNGRPLLRRPDEVH